MALQGDEAELKALTTSSISWQTLSSPHSDREIRRDRSFFCLGRWTAMCLLGDLAKKPSNTSLDNVWTAPIPICVASPLQSSVHDIPWCYGCSEEEKIRKNRKQKKELTEFAPSNIFVTGHVAYQFWETTVVLCHFGPKKWAPHSTATRALDLR